MFENESLETLTANEWFGIALLFCFGFLLIWYLLSAGSIRIGVWHAIFMGVASYLIGSALQEYTSLLDWIELGLTFENIGASLFVIGMVFMTAVMGWNLIASNGRTLVR